MSLVGIWYNETDAIELTIKNKEVIRIENLGKLFDTTSTDTVLGTDFIFNRQISTQNVR